MTNTDVLKRKVSEIEKYFQLLKPIRTKSKEEIQTDPIVYGAIERYLYLLCQATIDFAESIITYANLRKPGSYKEVFEILAEGEDRYISPALSLKMQKMAGFRNLLAHAYGKVDFDEIYQILKKDIDDFLLFIQEVKEKIHL